METSPTASQTAAPSALIELSEDDEIIAIDPSQQSMDAPGTTSLVTQR